jgi:hypothetical protein
LGLEQNVEDVKCGKGGVDTFVCAGEERLKMIKFNFAFSTKKIFYYQILV